MQDNEIQQLASDLAGELEGFTVRPLDPEYDYGHVVYLDHSDGRKLSIRRLWNKADRVEVHGIYPPNELYDRDAFKAEITVAITRGPAAIAAEIERRLMPGYVQQLAKVNESNDKDAAAHKARTEAAAKLAAIFADARVSDDGKNSTELHWYTGQSLDRGYGDIRLSYNATKATITAHGLPLEVAMKVARVIAKQS